MSNKYITILIIVCALILVSNVVCYHASFEDMEEKEVKPLTKREEILRLLDWKIKISDDPKEIAVIKDIQQEILARIEE